MGCKQRPIYKRHLINGAFACVLQLDALQKGFEILWRNCVNHMDLALFRIIEYSAYTIKRRLTIRVVMLWKGASILSLVDKGSKISTMLLPHPMLVKLHHPDYENGFSFSHHKCQLGNGNTTSFSQLGRQEWERPPPLSC